MILEKMEDVIPGWKDLIMVGSFGDVKRWLVENVHKHVRLYDPADLIRLITGKISTSNPSSGIWMTNTPNCMAIKIS